jgi:hypothetical protein
MNERGVRPYRSVASKTLEPPACAAAGPSATAAACIGVRAGARCAAAMGRTGSRGVVGVRGPRTAAGQQGFCGGVATRTRRLDLGDTILAPGFPLMRMQRGIKE